MEVAYRSASQLQTDGLFSATSTLFLRAVLTETLHQAYAELIHQPLTALICCLFRQHLSISLSDSHELLAASLIVQVIFLRHGVLMRNPLQVQARLHSWSLQARASSMSCGGKSLWSQATPDTLRALVRAHPAMAQTEQSQRCRQLTAQRWGSDRTSLRSDSRSKHSRLWTLLAKERGR